MREVVARRIIDMAQPPNSYELPRDSLFIPKPYGAAEILSAVRHFQ
jgi:hypothetical protein